MPTLVVSADDVARRAGLPLPMDADTQWRVEEAIADAQAIVESYLGIPVVPTTVTETGRWPAPTGWSSSAVGWNLCREPVFAVGAVAAEVDPLTGAPTGLYTVTYTWGLDGAAGAEYEPIRRWVLAHVGDNPLMMRLTAAAGVATARTVTSLSAEGQSVSYGEDPAARGGGQGPGGPPVLGPGGAPTLATLDRWRRANRRIYERPAAWY